jgi:hypothetical protein
MPKPTTPDDDNATGNAGDASAWLSVSAAALALGVSDKTIWRRARRGEITARKVKGARGVLVWEICLNHTGQSNRPTGQAIPATNAANRPTSPDIEREDTGQPLRPITGQPAKVTGQKKKKNGARLNEARDEIKFLRGVIEQLQRDGAETRAALRAALKLAGAASVPMLTAGDAPAMPQPTPPAPPQRKESGATVNDGAANVESSTRAPGARERPLTIGDIADELERKLNP